MKWPWSSNKQAKVQTTEVQLPAQTREESLRLRRQVQEHPGSALDLSVAGDINDYVRESRSELDGQPGTERRNG